MYEVLSPRGEPTVGEPTVAPRLSSLQGKTIGEISNGQFKSNVTFPIIRELLRKRYPDIRVIPYTEFQLQDIHGSTAQLQERVDAAVRAAIERGCDAIITGNGF